MPEDVIMTDISLEDLDSTKDQLKTVKALMVELTIVSNAVPAVDLRALSRLKISAIKKSMTPLLLKKCIKCFVRDKFFQDLLFQVLKSIPDSTKCDEKVEKLFESSKKNLDCPEIGYFFSILVIDHLLNRTKTELEVTSRFVTQLVVSLANQNRRTLDYFASRIYQYFGRITDDSELIRNDLLAIYRTACLRHDYGIQATTLNLILRNFLKYSLHEQASQFVAKTTFPEQHTNAEFARYLFYIGRMRSIQLNYSEAHAKFTQALRKAPQTVSQAKGFKVLAWKFALTVQLLMGEIPERKLFLQKELAGYLKPYEDMAQAVRGGSVIQYEETVKKHHHIYTSDETLTLINRLRYIVLKTGLRKINFSYSKISFNDIAIKLGLESPEGAACICAKAISDQVINATLDYEKQVLLSKSINDIYSTDAPQTELHKRIAFCLQLHNDCVRSMEYPSKDLKESNDMDNDPTKQNKDAAEIIAELEDEMDMM